jgi:hypothetical protein
MRRVVAPHTEDKTFSGAANLVPPIVLMVEGWADEDNFAKLLKKIWRLRLWRSMD